MAVLDGRALYFPIRDPDNRWLIHNLPHLSDPVDRTAQVLFELAACRVIPLPDVGGEVYT